MRFVLSALLISFLAACAPNVARERAPQQAMESRAEGGTMLRPGSAVGLLLPLSGANGALGQAMLNAAIMATYEIGAGDFALLPRDTASIPAAMQDFKNQNVALVLGPLTAEATQAVKAARDNAEPLLISFSNDKTLADRQTLLLGFMAAPQARRIIQFARTRGLKNIAVLAPMGVYGDLIAEEALAQNVPDIVRYNTPEQAVTRLAAGGKKFDALLLAEGGARLPPLLAALATAAYGPAQVKYLGTGLWDDQAVQNIPALKGAWFASSDPARQQNFARRYQTIYGTLPPRLASLAYDAVAMAAVNMRGGTLDRSGLYNPSGFAGVDGLFRLMPDGTTMRALAVIELTGGLPRLVSPAELSKTE